MSKKKDFDFGEEFTPETAEAEVTEVAADMEAEVPEVAEAVERKTYTLKDGSEGSRAAFIRELFLEDNLSRKEIAEKYEFDYRTVYSATVNMVNEAEPAGRGRAATNPIIKLTAEGEVVITGEDGNIYINGKLAEAMPAEDTLTEVKRNDWIKEQVAAGVSRGDIAKALDISYGVIYNLTKDSEGTRVKHMVTLDNGEQISRSAYIRQLFAEGKTRAEIAKELDVAYPVVWQATKTEKSDSEKYAELLEAIKAYGDKVDDEAAFLKAITALEGIDIKVSEEDAALASNEEETETETEA